MFEPESIVYDRDGREAVYIAHVPGAGHVVAYRYDDEQGGGTMEPELVREVYADVIGQRFHPEIAKAEADLAALRAQIRDAHAELNRERAARRASLKEIEAFAKDQPALGGLLAYLRGEITHYVVGYDILPAEKVEGRRLVSLVTAKGGGLGYQIATYHDGSGDRQGCVPACSLEEAREALARRVGACEREYEVRHAVRAHPDLPFTAAERERVDHLIAEHRESVRRSLQSQIDNLQARLEAL